MLRSVGQILFPHYCRCCGHELENRKILLCFSCKQNLPITGFSSIPNNPVEKIFAGRLDLQAATSGFYFSKGAILQKLIHELKYKENQAAGRYLGKLLGAEMRSSTRFHQLDMIIPMPMHAGKQKKRGYNQAECIAQGLSEILGVTMQNGFIQKKKATETQTRKDRISRWNNTADVFHVPDPKVFEQKRILLVDDVVTTGATIEACGTEILKSKGACLFVATIAVA